MKARNVLVNISVFSGVSALVVAAVYLVNLWLFSSNRRVSPTDALFIEGVIFLIIGFLLLLGRGGISRTSRGAAMLAALAGAVFKESPIGPSEMLRKDAWKAEGFTRIALILLISGVLMIVVYFVNL